MSRDEDESHLPTDGVQGAESINSDKINTESEKLRTVIAEMPESQFDRLDDLKDHLGLTWKGFLLFGYRCMMENYVPDDE